MDGFAGLLKDLYERTLHDNNEDFQKAYFVVVKLVSLLKLKGLLTEEDQNFILKIEKVENNESI